MGCLVTLLPLDVADLQQAGAAGSRRETSLDHAAVDCQQAHLYHLHRRIAEVKAHGLQIRRHLLPPAGVDGMGATGVVEGGENPLLATAVGTNVIERAGPSATPAHCSVPAQLPSPAHKAHVY